MYNGEGVGRKCLLKKPARLHQESQTHYVEEKVILVGALDIFATN
jgi:hypothetical protein